MIERDKIDRLTIPPDYISTLTQECRSRRQMTSVSPFMRRIDKNVSTICVSKVDDLEQMKEFLADA